MEKSSAKDAPRIGQEKHTLTLEDRQRAALTGVNEVLAFDENQVALSTGVGEIVLMGQNLHVTRLMLEEGQLTVEGRIDGIGYTEKKARRRGLRR